MSDLIKYVVTYLSDYPCGHRYPLQISVSANDVQGAIDKANETLCDDRIKSTNHSLFSVVPENNNDEVIGGNYIYT